MDLVAGAAVLVGRVGIASFNLGEILAFGDRSAECGARVAEHASIAALFFEEGSARP